KEFGKEQVTAKPDGGMAAEDFSFFVVEDNIPSVYWLIGGTSKEAIEAAKNGGPAIPSHHSPFFKIDPDGSIPFAVETTVVALLDLLKK
ncbi:MAG: amidohydrolase, partial [Colwellia sp.]